MPDLSFKEVAIGFDMFGCPNRCRHCFYGAMPNKGISEAEVRRIAGLFRDFRRDGEDTPLFEKVWISPHIREPDFSDHYRRLHELAADLSDGKPWRYELLSIWRLARDESYAEWARSVGPDTCQITFFGEEETTDWFCCRKGAFRDNLLATEHLLAVGMKPRWQLFANTRGIPEFESLLRRVDRMRLIERVEALGGEFDIFVHTWGVWGDALNIEHLRPTIQDVHKIPRELLESSRKHFGKETLWHTEDELCGQILAREPWFGYAIEPAQMPWFIITSGFDVFYNAFGYDPWFCLGNIKREPLDVVLARFENNDTPGLRTVYTVPPQELVRKYGQFDRQRVYGSTNDLLTLYVAKHCGHSRLT
ncbi:MAG: radical SAM protein [Planctomycetota bacterium]|nr:radical SAM protein [Planctomycetota bacterium]